MACPRARPGAKASQVASGGGQYQLAPAGMFQPSHSAPWNTANDFSLWRAITRELNEELLGGDEITEGLLHRLGERPAAHGDPRWVVIRFGVSEKRMYRNAKHCTDASLATPERTSCEIG